MPPDWKAIDAEGERTCYVHVPTGLRHYTRPKGIGIPLLKRWPVEDFKSYLDQADSAEIEGQPIWKLIEQSQFEYRDQGNQLEGVWDEREAFHVLSRALYDRLCFLVNKALENLQMNGFRFESNNVVEPQNRVGSIEYGRVGNYDWLLDMSLVNDKKKTRKYQNIASIISVTKLDYQFPCTKYECSQCEQHVEMT